MAEAGVRGTSDGVGRRPTRRVFLRNAARTGLAAGALGAYVALRGRGVDGAAPGTRAGLGIVRPPGSLDEKEFLAKCIRCTLCADACEAQCIRFFGADAGAGQATPFIVPAERGCTMCLACGEACPSGAILPLEDMRRVKMGIAVVDERLCVSHNGTGVCGACHTVCPLRNDAIVQNFRNAPVINADVCTGCGLCEEVCIVHDRKAIRVQTRRLGTDNAAAKGAAA